MCGSVSDHCKLFIRTLQTAHFSAVPPRVAPSRRPPIGPLALVLPTFVSEFQCELRNCLSCRNS